jgi:subtilisin family serine protease
LITDHKNHLGFFVNENGNTVPRSGTANPTYDNSFRKVIQYVRGAGNGYDTEGGHGSHVCGTIAGFVVDIDTNLNGHAPDAKIAFFDMSTDGNSISYPTPMSQYVFPAAHNAGARLHSNSWGSGDNMYDSDVIDIDKYHYETEDFLVLFAAGNDGADGYYSIGSPAVSKNALAVGATQDESSAEVGDMAYFSSIGPTFDGRIKPDISAPGFYTSSTYAKLTTMDNCYVTDMAGKFLWKMYLLL